MMKNIKKLLALVLSILMIATIVIIPASAEDTITKDFNLLNLDNVEVGALEELPASISTYRYSFNGDMEVVDLGEGAKGLKVSTKTMTGTGSDKIAEGSYENMFGIKLNVPAASVALAKGIKLKINKQTNKTIVYNFGITDGSNYSKVSETNSMLYDDAAATDITVERTMSQLKKNDDEWYWGHWGNPGDPWTDNFTHLYFCFGAVTTDEADPYIVIEEMSLVLEGTAEEIDAATSLKISKTIELLDLSEAQVGALSDYPNGAASYRYGLKNELSVVELENGSKALKINTANMTGNGSDKIDEGGYENMFGMGIQIPYQYSPYISKITLKLEKNTTATLVHNFGVASGDAFSKFGECNDLMSPAVYGDTTFERDINDLKKIGDGWWWGHWGNPGDPWDVFDTVYFVFGSTESFDDDPNVIIKSISFTASATQEEWDALEETLTPDPTKKLLIIDYDRGNGTKVDAAHSGDGVYAYTANGGYNGRTFAEFASNKLYKDSVGVKFWAYNNSDEAHNNLMFFLYSTDIYMHRVELEPKTWTEVVIMFDNVKKKISGDDWWGDGETVAMTKTDIANLDSIVVRDWNRTNTEFYIDDVYLIKYCEPEEHIYTDDADTTCDVCGKERSFIKLVTEPKDTYTKSGSKATVSVGVEGENLTYTWYVKNAGATKFTKSSVTKATYSVTMSSTVKNRQVYCVVTDGKGNSVTSKTVTMYMAASITTQPKTTYTKSAAKANVTVKAAGDGLKYTWYVKNSGATKYSKSSITKSTYSVTMTSKVKDRLVYCVVTDKYGKTVKSDTVRMRMAATITTQPKSVKVALNKTAKVTVKATGDGLKYTWYIKNKGASKYTKSSVTKSTYSVKMTSKVNGRYVYCVVKDKYGKTVKSNTVSLRKK